MQTKVRAIKAEAGVEVDLVASEGGVLATLPYQVLWTAKGYGRQAMSTAAAASVVARPSTTAMVSLYNIGTNYFVMERAFAHGLVSVANSFYGLWLCVHPAGTIVAGYANDITARNGTSGGTVAGGYFDIDDTVADGGWFPWGESGSVITVTTPGSQILAEIGGRIIVPPTAGISLQVVSNHVNNTFTAGFHWFEVPTSGLALG